MLPATMSLVVSRSLLTVSNGQLSLTSTEPTLSITLPRFSTYTVRVISEPEFIGPTGSEILTSKSYMVGMISSPVPVLESGIG